MTKRLTLKHAEAATTNSEHRILEGSKRELQGEIFDWIGQTVEIPDNLEVDFEGATIGFGTYSINDGYGGGSFRAGTIYWKKRIKFLKFKWVINKKMRLAWCGLKQLKQIIKENNEADKND